jgi:hypothetical protein
MTNGKPEQITELEQERFLRRREKIARLNAELAVANLEAKQIADAICAAYDIDPQAGDDVNFETRIIKRAAKEPPPQQQPPHESGHDTSMAS